MWDGSLDPDPRHTGIVCPAWKRPVALIVNILKRVLPTTLPSAWKRMDGRGIQKASAVESSKKRRALLPSGTCILRPIHTTGIPDTETANPSCPTRKIPENALSHLQSSVRTARRSGACGSQRSSWTAPDISTSTARLVTMSGWNVSGAPKNGCCSIFLRWTCKAPR